MDRRRGCKVGIQWRVSRLVADNAKCDVIATVGMVVDCRTRGRQQSDNMMLSNQAERNAMDRGVNILGKPHQLPLSSSPPFLECPVFSNFEFLEAVFPSSFCLTSRLTCIVTRSFPIQITDQPSEVKLVLGDVLFDCESRDR